MAIGILGGGLAGIGIAAHLNQDCEVLEKESRGGGHCLSVQEHGFTYDAGGPHIIFSRNQEMVDYMVALLDGNVHRARRNNKIFYQGRYVKYPFENGLYDLDPQDRFECLYHYIKNDYPPPKTNFKEWIYHHFGKGLAEKYLIPYNEKIWNVPAEELGLEWVEGRVPKPPFEDVIKAAVGVETEGYTHQLYFNYPLARRHRSRSARALAERVPQHLAGFQRWAASGRSAGNGASRTGAVTRRSMTRIVSTIPIQELVARGARNAARDHRRGRFAALQLAHHSRGRPRFSPPARLHRHLRSRSQIRFHRLSFPAVFSPHNAPPGKSIIEAEITTNPGDGTHEMSDEAILADVVGEP